MNKRKTITIDKILENNPKIDIELVEKSDALRRESKNIPFRTIKK